jgi:uncharacterized protein
MGILTEDMKRVVNEQQLGFIATICPDSTPNLSPKGTTAVLDDDHLVFADVCSPGTIANLRLNPAVEINVVDPLCRKGYRFKGVAAILSEGPRFEEVLEFLSEARVDQRQASRRSVEGNSRCSPDFARIRRRPERSSGERTLAALLGGAMESSIPEPQQLKNREEGWGHIFTM